MSTAERPGHGIRSTGSPTSSEPPATSIGTARGASPFGYRPDTDEGQKPEGILSSQLTALRTVVIRTGIEYRARAHQSNYYSALRA